MEYKVVDWSVKNPYIVEINGARVSDKSLSESKGDLTPMPRILKPFTESVKGFFYVL